MGGSTSGRSSRGRTGRRTEPSRRPGTTPRRRPRSRVADEYDGDLHTPVPPAPQVAPLTSEEIPVDDVLETPVRPTRRSDRGRGRNRPAKTALADRLRGVDPKRAVVIGLVVVFLAVTLAVPVRTYLTQRGEFQELKATNEQLKREVADYERKVVEQDDPAYIEAQARKRLQMVKRGEKQVVVIAPDREQQEAAERAEAQRRANPWYENIWDAVSTPPEGK